VPAAITLANARVGGSSTAALTLANLAAGDGFSEALDASIGGAGGGITASGAIHWLGAGMSDHAGLLVGLDTSAAGGQPDGATITLVSDGQSTSGLGLTDLRTQGVQVSGSVYREASVSIAAPPTSFIVHVGDTVAQGLTVTNTAANDGFSENLIASILGT